MLFIKFTIKVFTNVLQFHGILVTMLLIKFLLIDFLILLLNPNLQSLSLRRYLHLIHETIYINSIHFGK